jgi:hypothetical protein
MTDSPKDEGGRTAEQVQKDLLADNTAPTASTASGLAAMGSPKGKNIAQDNDSNTGIEPDAVKAGSPPKGLQAEAAFFTRTGSIPGNSVPSPSGPVPASTIADEATRNAAVEQARAGATRERQGRNGRFRLSDEYAQRLSPAELRAVASDRGYPDVFGGRQTVLAKFLDAQKKDQSLDTPPDDHPFAGKGAPAAGSVPVGTTPATGNPLLTPSAPGGVQTPAGTLRNTDGSTPTTPAPRPAPPK